MVVRHVLRAIMVKEMALIEHVVHVSTAQSSRWNPTRSWKRGVDMIKDLLLCQDCDKRPACFEKRGCEGCLWDNYNPHYLCVKRTRRISANISS